MRFTPDHVPPSADASAGDGVEGNATPPRGETPTADILPYVVPMFAYVTLGGLEGYLPQLDSHPSPTWYPIAYALRVVIVAATVWYYRSIWKDLRPFPSFASIGLAVITGLLVTVLWVGLDGLYPIFPFLGKRVLVRPDPDVPGGATGLLCRPSDWPGDPRSPHRGAVLEVVPHPMGDRPGLPADSDREGDALLGGRDLRPVRRGPSRMAAGRADRTALGLATPSDQVPGRLPHQPCPGQPGAWGST